MTGPVPSREKRTMGLRVLAKEKKIALNTREAEVRNP